MSDGTHPCPKTGCPERLPFEIFACKKHWFQIPTGVRRMIWRAWTSGDLSEHTRLRNLATAMLNEVRA